MSDDKGLKFWKIFLSDLYRNAEKKKHVIPSRLYSKRKYGN